MALSGLPHPPQSRAAGLSTPIKSNGHWAKRRFQRVRADGPAAFEIQADFNCAGMESLAPIERLMRFEIVPLEADA